MQYKERKKSKVISFIKYFPLILLYYSSRRAPYNSNTKEIGYKAYKGSKRKREREKGKLQLKAP